MFAPIRIAAFALLALCAPANAGQTDRKSTVFSAAIPERINREPVAGSGHGLAMPEGRTIAAEMASACALPAAGHDSRSGPDRSGLAASWGIAHLSRDSACSPG